MLLLAIACSEDGTTIQGTQPGPCGDGFGRGDDGNCYELAASETWEAVEIACQGEDDDYVSTLDVGWNGDGQPPLVEAWGTVTTDPAYMVISTDTRTNDGAMVQEVQPLSFDADDDLQVPCDSWAYTAGDANYW